MVSGGGPSGAGAPQAERTSGSGDRSESGLKDPAIPPVTALTTWTTRRTVNFLHCSPRDCYFSRWTRPIEEA